MLKRALLFIPDISGFTEFVHHTDITHCRHIISELFEILIDTNNMDLQLAEIERDADFKPLGIIMKPLLKKNFEKVISENIKELILLINSEFSTNKK